MAYIPTTERKYYNTEKKLNTLAAYSSAMLPAAQNLQEVIAQQEEIKMDSYALEARMEMNEITNNWRIQNEGNPTDPTALKDLQSQYDNVLGKYREQVDPLYRYNWDIAGNKLKGAFDLQNQEWGFAQKQKNARANIARSVDNYIKLAYQYGQEDSEAEAMADFAQSYQKLLDYGAKNLGAEDAANMLKNYQEKFVTNYIGGVASKDPQKALDMLQNDEKLKEVIGDDSYKMMNKIIKAEKEKQDFQIQYNQYQTQFQLDNELDNMSPFEAMRYLQENESKVSNKWYKAKMQSLEAQSGVNADTRADTYSKYLLQINALSVDNSTDFIRATNDIITNIEKDYGQGRLNPQDKKTLINRLRTSQGKQLPKFIEDNNKWFSYDYEDAYGDFKNSLYNPMLADEALLEYDRTLAQENYDGSKGQDLVKEIVSDYNNKYLDVNTTKAKITKSWGYKVLNGFPSFKTMEEAKNAYKDGIIKKGDYVYINGDLGVL